MSDGGPALMMTVFLLFRYAWCSISPHNVLVSFRSSGHLRLSVLLKLLPYPCPLGRNESTSPMLPAQLITTNALILSKGGVRRMMSYAARSSETEKGFQSRGSQQSLCLIQITRFLHDNTGVFLGGSKIEWQQHLSRNCKIYEIIRLDSIFYKILRHRL